MERPSFERKEQKKISKIHFLIHPGYDKDMPELFDLYLEKAKSLKDNELMIAFPHIRRTEGRKSQLKEDIKGGEGYVETIKK